MTTPETPYTPAHALPTPDLTSRIHAIPQQLGELAHGAGDLVKETCAYVQSAAMAHAARQAETGNITVARRVWNRVGSVGLLATVGVLTARATGVAAHGLELTGWVHDLPLPAGGSNAFSTLPDGHHAVSAPHDIVLAAHTTSLHSDGSLPADLNQAPDLGPLGPYNAHTGAGTIWHQVEQYAGQMGYGKLTETQKRHLVGNALHHMGESWGSATHKHADYHADLPPQKTMQAWLHDVGAHKTHAADRAPAAPAGGSTSGNADLPPKGQSSGHDGAAPPSGDAARAPHTPWYRREVIPDLTKLDIDWVNVGAAAATVVVVEGAFGGAVAAGNAVDRRRALRRQYRIMNEPTREQPIVDASGRPVVAAEPLTGDEPPQRFSTENTVPRHEDWQYGTNAAAVPTELPLPIAGHRPAHAAPTTTPVIDRQESAAPVIEDTAPADGRAEAAEAGKPFWRRGSGFLTNNGWPWRRGRGGNANRPKLYQRLRAHIPGRG